ncbi:U7 snRNA-associated Sm-like protein LSm11 [Mizuhopecten yessoensis]|uniref:U7 snRNA-associated Sm-like protein LSm11 n=1 Tax=Mizuhopecten yessoensis TaxID=6573 RepID=UPI000B45EB62|nr:U7 snRNA-associated Sm-like protein LSm11 [Mizuhopecten yessoensis]
MAAPIEQPVKRKTTKLPPEIDLTSPHFDPSKALFSSHVLLPFASAEPLDNLARFESWSKQSKKNEAIHNLENLPVEVESERKPIHKIIVKPATVDLSKHSGRHRNKLNRNVLTRMKEYEKGPLSFLKKCVENRHVVKIWTRNACELRGFCTGYLVAFDKYFNLALMDVDETYRKPVSRDNRIRKCTEILQVIAVSDQKESDPVIHIEEGDSAETPITSQETTFRPSVENNVNAMENLKITTVEKSQESTHSCSEKEIACISSVSNCVASTVSNCEKKLATKSSQDTCRAEEQTVRVAESESIDFNEPCTDISDKPSDKSKSDKRTKKVKSENMDQMMPSFDAAKVARVWQDTVARDKSKPPLALKYRHANQLFIRGDNVVSVSLVYA